MKCFSKEIVEAIEKEDFELAEKAVNDGLNYMGGRMLDIIHEVHPKDRHLLLAAMKLLIPNMERAIGPTGVELANDMVECSITVSMMPPVKNSGDET